MIKNKVILFERGPDFYFDLGYKNIQKGDLKTALRYIEKAVSLKPKDSYMQFNYAGILAELGDVERSTEVLLHIVEELDPDYAECYFGLGCNFLQLQKIKRSIDYFSLYLEKDPDGEFSEESEDLLDMLIMIKDANNDMDDEDLEKVYSVEEEAIEHLEKREYDKAAEKFEEVLRLLPNAVPARNNLSLAYYYLGQIEKAIELAREVLTFEEDNVHANCNLSVFYNKLNLTDWVNKQIKQIKKLNTDNEDYLYKIADTFGSLGKHLDAYKVFKRLLAVEPESDLYLHFAALAAYNAKRFKESQGLWEKLFEIDKDSLLASYYIDKAAEAAENEEEFKPLAYIYQLPREEVNQRMDRIYAFISMSGDECRKLLTEDDKMLEILYFGMNFDRLLLRKLIYNKIKTEKLTAVEGIIRKFILKPEVENDIKMESIFLLNMLGAKVPYTANFDGEIRNVTIDPLSFPPSQWKEEWEAVKAKVFEIMSENYDESHKKIIEDIWYGFIKATYPDVPPITKVEVWAAALEYAYCRFYCTDITQQQIADKYNIPKSSLGEKFRIIYNSLGKKHKE